MLTGRRSITNSQHVTHHTMPAPEQAQQSGPTSRLKIALAYIKRGWALVPIPLGEKAPRIRGWTKLRITEGEAPSYFDGPGNIGRYSR